MEKRTRQIPVHPPPDIQGAHPQVGGQISVPSKDYGLDLSARGSEVLMVYVNVVWPVCVVVHDRAAVTTHESR